METKLLNRLLNMPMLKLVREMRWLLKSENNQLFFLNGLYIIHIRAFLTYDELPMSMNEMVRQAYSDKITKRHRKYFKILHRYLTPAELAEIVRNLRQHNDVVTIRYMFRQFATIYSQLLETQKLKLNAVNVNPSGGGSLGDEGNLRC